MKIITSVISIATSFFVASLTQGQTQNASVPSAISITSFKVEQAKLPSGTKAWTKLICAFTNSAGWSDGISFNYTVLVQPASGTPSAGGSPRYLILTGGLTFMNVPKGPSEAILYLSPSASARYGMPIAANVEVFRGDRSMGNFEWKGTSPLPATDWPSKYQSLGGILQTIRSTPWIFSDAERSPDILTN